jgi:gliding motility-associated-like protein
LKRNPLFVILLWVLLGFSTLHAQVTANFTANIIAGCSPKTIVFTNTSTGNPNKYFWNLGNLNYSVNRDASGNYVNPGVYTISLTVYNGNDSSTKSMNITIYANPVANISAVPQSGCAPLQVAFSDQTTGGAAINTWTWDYGNGNTGSIKNPVNTYAVPGTYDVTLAVKDINGCESTVTKKTYITVTPGFTADFSSSTNVACTAPATVQFNSSVSTPAGYTYSWKFGDNSTGTGANASHTYTATGTYTVELEVTSPSGCKQKIVKNAFVQIGVLKAGFTYTTNSNCAPAVIFLTNTSTPNPSALTFTWQVNGGQDRPNQNTNYTLTAKNNVIRLIAKDAAGCRDTVEQTVTLLDGPTANFTVDKDVFCDVPAVVNFTDASTGSPTTWAWNFGNSIGASTQNATTTYNNEGTFTARVIVGKGGSCRDTAYHTIIVAKPAVDITLQNQKSGCAPYNAVLNAVDKSVIPLTTWRWELNGTAVSTSPSFNYNITQKGTYIFKLIASNSAGCQYITYDTVKVGLLPNFDFTVDKKIICYNPGEATFTYTKLDTVTPDGVNWIIFNGNVVINQTGLKPTVHFSDTGSYTVRVIANNNGCIKELVKPLYVKVIPPIAKFTFRTDTCKTDTVTFTNQSAGTANTFLWNFDDTSSASTAENPIHAYYTPKVYNVKLIVSDSITGCQDTVIRQVNIIAQPRVMFTPADTAVCMGAIVTFTSITESDTSQKIIDWRYQRSDGTIVPTNPAKFGFNNPGIFGMTLTVRDKKNCFYKYTDTAVVKVYDGKPGFTLSPNSGCVPFVVQVKDTSKIENPIASRKWVFSTIDSITLTTGDQTTFLYQQPAANQSVGNTVTLTVTDNKGCTFKSSKIVKNTKPIPNFSSTLVKSCGIDSFTLTSVVTAASALPPVQFNWSLPKNQTSTATQLKLGYSGDTTYQVKMVITDGQGCKDSITKPLKVNTKAPKIGFDGTPRVIACYKTQPPPLILFTDTSKPGGSPIVKREWNLGNSSNTITKIGKDSTKASTFYIRPGKYPVTLKITDSIGCTDSARIPDFIVAGGPYGSYSFTPNRGCNPITVDFTSTSPNAAAFVWDHADGTVDTITTYTHSYEYTREGVYYPRLTMIDSTFTCDYGLDLIDSIVVLPLPKPDFGTSATVICQDGYITFTNQTAPHPYPIYDWKWKIGIDSILSKNAGTVQFPDTGKFTISLEATDSNGCYGIIVKDSLINVVFDTIPPAIPLVKRATVQNNEEVLFEYLPNTEFDFGRYIIYSTTNQYNKESIYDTSLLETGLNTLEFPYTYQLQAMDVCRNISGMSEQHQTVELKAKGSVNSVALDWTPYTGFDTTLVYEIWRTTAPDFPYSLLTTVPVTTLHYDDTSVLCHQVYYYHIRTVETDSMLQVSWSDTAGAIPEYVPVLPTPENIRTTVVNNKYVLLEWHKVLHNRIFTFHIYRSTDSGEAVLYKKLASSDTTFMDMNVDVQEHSYTYTTYVVDACGGRSAPSNAARTILLHVRMVGNDILKHDPKLTWNEYMLWGTGVDHYIADFYNEVEQAYQVVSYNKAGQLEARHKYVNLIQDDYCYKITGYKGGDTTIISESNVNCVSTEPRLYAPNVFTVNGDNLNDVFYVRGVFIETFSLKIYNRWGQLVFETNDMNKGWNGTFEGKLCQSDVYIFKAEGTGRKGQRTELAGNVTLLR